MSLGDRGWADRYENYADGWTKSLAVSTAENVLGVDVNQPVVVYSITIAPSQNNASGEIALVDGSATGDSGDTRRFRYTIASAATTDRPSGLHCDFPRGIVFDTGLIVSGATMTGSVSLTYKARYP